MDDKTFIDRCTLNDGCTEAECNHSMPIRVARICNYKGECRHRVKSEVVIIDHYKPADTNEKQ